MSGDLAPVPDWNPLNAVRQYLRNNQLADADAFHQAQTAPLVFSALGDQTAFSNPRRLVELAIAVLSHDEARLEHASVLPTPLTAEVTVILEAIAQRLRGVHRISAKPNTTAVAQIDAALGFNGTLSKRLGRTGADGDPETILRDALRGVLVCLYHPIAKSDSLSLETLRGQLAVELETGFRRDFVFDIVTAFGAGWSRSIQLTRGQQSTGWEGHWVTSLYRLATMTPADVVDAIGWLREFVDQFSEAFAQAELEVNPHDDEAYRKAVWRWAYRESTLLAWQFASNRDTCPPAARLSAWNPLARTLRQHLAVAVRGFMKPGSRMLSKAFSRSLLGQRLVQFVEMQTVATCICEQCNAGYLASDLPKGKFDKFDREPDGAVFGVYEGDKCRARHPRTAHTPIWAREDRFIVPSTEYGAYEEWRCYQCANTNCYHLYDLGHDHCPLCGTPTNKQKDRLVFRLNARRQAGVVGRSLPLDLASHQSLSMDRKRTDLMHDLIGEWFERYQERLVKVSSQLIPIARQSKYQPLGIKGVWDLHHCLQVFQDGSVPLTDGREVLVILDSFDRATALWRLQLI